MTSAMAILAAGMTLAAGSANATVRLKLADALAADHPTSMVLEQFAEEVEEKPTAKSRSGSI